MAASVVEKGPISGCSILTGRDVFSLVYRTTKIRWLKAGIARGYTNWPMQLVQGRCQTVNND